jgi:hypothetical protein
VHQGQPVPGDGQAGGELAGRPGGVVAQLAGEHPDRQWQVAAQAGDLTHRGIPSGQSGPNRQRPPPWSAAQVSVGVGRCIMNGAVPAVGRICRAGPVPSTNQPFNSASTSEIAMNRIHPIRRRMRWAAGCRRDQGGRHDERG